jgi:hypothetical protein
MCKSVCVVLCKTIHRALKFASEEMFTVVYEC